MTLVDGLEMVFKYPIFSRYTPLKGYAWLSPHMRMLDKVNACLVTSINQKKPNTLGFKLYNQPLLSPSLPILHGVFCTKTHRLEIS